LFSGVLADRTAHSMIGYWHNSVVRLSICLTVCLSVRLFVTLCIMAKRHKAKVSEQVNKK